MILMTMMMFIVMMIIVVIKLMTIVIMVLCYELKYQHNYVLSIYLIIHQVMLIEQ